MKNIFQYFKTNHKTLLGTIMLYQVFLTVFFFTSINLKILGGLIVVLALTVLLEKYSDPIRSKFKIKE